MIDQMKQIPSFFFLCIISPNVLDIAYISLEYSDKIELKRLSSPRYRHKYDTDTDTKKGEKYKQLYIV